MAERRITPAFSARGGERGFLSSTRIRNENYSSSLSWPPPPVRAKRGRKACLTMRPSSRRVSTRRMKLFALADARALGGRVKPAHDKEWVSSFRKCSARATLLPTVRSRPYHLSWPVLSQRAATSPRGVPECSAPVRRKRVSADRAFEGTDCSRVRPACRPAPVRSCSARWAGMSPIGAVSRGIGHRRRRFPS